MAHSTKAPAWSEAEFSRLQELILETVSGGGTVMQACEQFEEETGGLRSISANRFKFATVIKPRCEFEYAEAQQKGAEANAQRALSGKRENVRPTISRVVKLRTKEDDGEVVRMTKRDLIKLIRNVDIVDEDSEHLKDENESLKQQLQDAIRERDELKHKNLLLEKKYDESQAELSKLLDAFNIARQHATGVTSPASAKMVVDRQGNLVKVETK